jgi:peptidoglycan/LPS O-acetylase OafA/YrhL
MSNETGHWDRRQVLEQSILLLIAAASYLIWLLHSFAVQSFLKSLHRLAAKFL